MTQARPLLLPSIIRMAGEAAASLPEPGGLHYILLAAKTEAGEFCQAIKGEWAWWKRHGKGFTSSSVEAAEELADVLLFIATYLYRDARSAAHPRGLDTEVLGRLYEDAWTFERWKHRDPAAILHGLFVPDLYRNIATIPQAAQLIGLSRDKFDETIIRKTALNSERWKEQ